MENIAKQVAIEGFAENPRQWLSDFVLKKEKFTLLVISDIGIGFGTYDGQNLVFDESIAHILTSENVRKLTQLYVFNEWRQVFVWKQGQSFNASRIDDDNHKEKDSYGLDAFKNEIYMLWGSAVQLESGGNFTLFEEPKRGFKFSVPLKLSVGKHAALHVRHYYLEDENGQLYIAGSRLFDLKEVE